MNEKLKLLAKGRSGKLLLELMREIQMKVADIREPIPVKKEIAEDVRLGVIGVLEKFIISPLKVAGGVVEPPISGDAKEYE
jgi:hypothetical protein